MTPFHSKLVRWAVPENTHMNNGLSASMTNQNVDQGTKASSKNKTHTTIDTKAKNAQGEKAGLDTNHDYKGMFLEKHRLGKPRTPYHK